MTKTTQHHIQEGQKVIPFPAGEHKAAMNRQESMTNTKQKFQKRSTEEAPPWNSHKNIFTGELKLVKWLFC